MKYYQVNSKVQAFQFFFASHLKAFQITQGTLVHSTTELATKGGHSCKRAHLIYFQWSYVYKKYWLHHTLFSNFFYSFLCKII